MEVIYLHFSFVYFLFVQFSEKCTIELSEISPLHS